MASAAMSECLEALNASRGEAGLPALEVDATAETAASAHATSMAENGFLSHWGLDGRNPYMRYAFGGSRHHVRELIHGEDGNYGDDAVSQAEKLSGLCASARSALEKDAQGAAHAQHATHVCFGIALTATHFRFVMCYVTARVDLDEVACPDELLAPELTLSGSVVAHGKEPLGPFAAVVYYDPPPLALSVDELRSSYAGPYDDFSPEQMNVVWPWDFTFSAADGTFAARLRVCGDMALRPGSYYVQLYLRDKVDDIPYDGARQDGIEVPGDDSVCVTGIVLTVGEHLAAGGQLAAGSNASNEPSDLTLEEQAARHDALAAATKPDGGPITHLEILHGVGALSAPGEDFEKAIYMPVERAEQLTTPNLGVSFKRLAPEELADDNDPLVIVDVTVVEGTGPVDAPEGFELVDANLLPPDDAAAAPGDDGAQGAPDKTTPKALLCVKRSPASVAGNAVVVDLAVVYGPPAGTRDAGGAFDMGGGYETVPLPPMVTAAYGTTICVCVKREGAGQAAAERLASAAAVEAAAAMRAEDDGFEGESVPGFEPLDEDHDDEEDLLDTTLTPEQVCKLEEQRAEKLREAEARADAEAMERDALAQKEQMVQELQSLSEQKAEQLATNAELQRRLAALLASTKRAEQVGNDRKQDKDSATPAHEGEKQYSDALSAILDAKRRAASMKDEYDRGAFDLQTRLDEKEFKAKKISDSFREFKHEIALSAENSRTSKPIPRRIISQFEDLELRREAEVEKVRLKNINLRMTLRKLEASLRAKEQLAEGLHLIDFEQLKIENQTLNEKIEERNEELHKLRKKNTANVQVLTHFKEKLQFVVGENGVVRSELSELDEALGNERDRVAKAKTERESLKADNAGLRQRQGFANNDLLVIDFEKRKTDLSRTEQKIAELKERYSLLQSECNKANAVIAAHTAE